MKIVNMKRLIQLAAFCLIAYAPNGFSEPGYVGSAQCQNCHSEQFSSWQKSHHQQALTESVNLELPQFDGSTLQVSNRSISFLSDKAGYFITEQIGDQPRTRHRVVLAIGFHPLQQYVVDKGDGHLQVFDVAWDSRALDEGGQRWFVIDIDQATDSLSWHGSFMNWNSRCASCHTTNYVRNFDAINNSYDSRWSEPAVGCESCHGPATGHLKWSISADKSVTNKGFLKLIGSKIEWDNSAATPLSKSRSDTTVSELETCFNCHARRQLLKDESNQQPFSENARIRLLEPELYFPDGQIKDEVFVAGSFLQSKMYDAGVVCSNCHDPHSNQLIKTGNEVCTQCHTAASYDTAEHHHHENNSGSECISCHMPQRTYMEVDQRADHGFQVPNPILSQQLGTPNTCAQCHDNSEWLQVNVAKWWPSLIQGESTRTETANLLHGFWQQKPQNKWQTELKKLITENHSDYVKASLISTNPQALEFADRLSVLASSNPLLQVEGLNIATNYPPSKIMQSTLPLLRSEALNTRIAAFRFLLPYSRYWTAYPEYKTELLAVEKEYLNSLQLNRDTPMGKVEQANYALLKGNTSAAISQLKKAIAQEPGFLIAPINLADLYRQIGDEGSALKVLQQALIYHKNNYLLQYSLGLVYARIKQPEKTLFHLKNAYLFSDNQLEFGLTYLVALSSFAEREKFQTLLQELKRLYPDEERLKAYDSSFN